MDLCNSLAGGGIVCWWVRLVAYIGAWLNYCPRRRETITAVCRWLWAPGLFLLVALLVRADVPISARFRLSLPDMERLRLQAIAQQTPSPHPTGPRMTQMFAVLPSQKVGLFWIKQAVAVDGDFQLWLIDQDLRWSYRFEYLKDDPSPPCAKDGEWHTVHERSADRRWIQGNWYLWRNVP